MGCDVTLVGAEVQRCRAVTVPSETSTTVSREKRRILMGPW